jgi:hypothetical protein
MLKLSTPVFGLHFTSYDLAAFEYRSLKIRAFATVIFTFCRMLEMYSTLRKLELWYLLSLSGHDATLTPLANLAIFPAYRASCASVLSALHDPNQYLELRQSSVMLLSLQSHDQEAAVRQPIQRRIHYRLL